MRIYILSLFSAIIVLSSATVLAGNAQIKILFNKASEAYAKEDYDQAIESYTQIIGQGKESGAVFFNLANAYYKKGDFGKAILNYKRAILLNPRDRDINYNYKYLARQLGLKDLRQEKNLINKIMGVHVSFYTMDEMVIIISILFGLVGMALVCSVYFNWNKRTFVSSTIVMTLFIIVFIAGLVIKGEESFNTFIAVDNQDSKFEPRDLATTHFKIKEGETLKVIKEQEGWFKIERFDGKIGWVVKKSVEKI